MALKVGLFLILAVVVTNSEAWSKQKQVIDGERIFPELPDKTSWPEVVGISGDEAKAYILNENPSLQVEILPNGGFMTLDYGFSRVRIFVDEEGIVVSTPHIG